MKKKVDSINIHENDYPVFTLVVELSDWNVPLTVYGDYSSGVLPMVIGAGCGLHPPPDFRMCSAWVQAADDLPLKVSLTNLHGYDLEGEIAEFLCKEGV